MKLNTDPVEPGLSLLEAISKALCWFFGGIWHSGTEDDPGAHGELGMPGCDYSQIETPPIVPGYIGFPAGVWYGQGTPILPPDNSGGGGGSPANAPYGGGPVWVSTWIPDHPNGCPVAGPDGDPNNGGGGGPAGYIFIVFQ